MNPTLSQHSSNLKILISVLIITILILSGFLIRIIYPRSTSNAPILESSDSSSLASTTDPLVSMGNVANDYSKSSFKVIKIIKSDKSPSTLYVVTERDHHDFANRGNDTACGSIYTEPTCYFFLEPDFDVRAEPLKYLGKWSGGLGGLGPESNIFFYDADNIRFESGGGDGGVLEDVIYNLNISTGKITETENKSQF
jgi:hypothetical protein